MKKTLLLVLLSITSTLGFAQYNFYKFSATAGVGGTSFYGDMATKPSYAGNVNLDFNITPFSTLGVEVVKGQFDSNPDVHLRQFTNSFLAYNINGKLTLGQVVDFESSNFLYAIRNLYLGVGVGMIKNKHTSIVRTKTNPDGNPYTFPGESDGSSMYVPVNLGYKFMIQDRFGFNRYQVQLNYQFNTAMKDNLDGYQDPLYLGNKFKDFYSVFTLGLGISFGPEGLY
ncbi:hypothetical protein [Pedobacter sp. SYSU D00535]|uniref:hypothetical protein n=1 Tax=Pedobacter sp. SYSU D00535 TaxID=2810308 RepID=UPI001A95D66F|nr:hypothetical protein [Pedobacter sp. SYSU D00535]